MLIIVTYNERGCALAYFKNNADYKLSIITLTIVQTPLNSLA